jgi:hypothetical protein
MAAILAAVPAVALAAILGSCATSSGSTFSDAQSSEAAAAAKARTAPRRPSQPSPVQPPFQNNPQPAPARPSPSFPSSGGDASPPSGGLFVFAARPAPAPTGRLLLEGLEPGSDVLVDGDLYLGPSITLRVGSHSLRVSRFGYRDFTADLFVSVDQTERLRVEYERSPFSIRAFESVPSEFDPEDPGFLGSAEARILVRGPGEGRLTVLDGEGRPVRDLGSASFSGPSFSRRWDGRDDSGKALPPGAYLIRAEGRDADGGSDSAEAKVSIISGAYSRSASLYSGVSGSLFAPDARSLAAGRLEFGSGAEMHLSPTGSAMGGLATARAGARLGLPIASGSSELDLSWAGALWGDSALDSYSICAAWKYSPTAATGATAGGTMAVYVKASLARFFGEDPESEVLPSWDGMTRYSGLSIGLPLEYFSGTIRAFAVPEIEASSYYPGWASDTRWTPPGFFAWAYLRLGFEASSGRWTAALSSALRSAPFGGPFELAGPFPIGLELRWHAPSSPLVLSLAATGEFESMTDCYLGGGIGLGFRF